MPQLTKQQRVWIAAESGGFGVDPSASGAGYTPLRVFGALSFVQDQKGVLETNYFTGRNTMTPHEMGADGGQITFDTPLLGLATAAGSGASPGSDDWFDILLESAFGASVDYAGMAVTSSTSTTLTTGTSTAGAQDLLAVRDAAVNSGRMMWRRTSSSASPYTVNRAWEANPTATAIAYGIKRWGPLSDPGGNSVALQYELDGTEYTLLGCRPTALKLTMVAKEMVKLSWTVRYDSKTQAAKASLPAFAAWTGTPIKGILSCLEWGSTVYDTKQIEVDWRLTSSDSDSTCGVNGRSNIENLMAMPLVTATPLFATSWQNDFRAGTTRNMAIRFGEGALSGGAVNSCALWFEAGQIPEQSEQDDGGRVRSQVQIAARDAGIQTGTTPWREWQFARA